MTKKKAKKSPHRTDDNYVYLTKRMVVRKAAQAGQEASADAMERMGYIVTVEKEWIVKKYKDGNVERIKRVEENAN